MAVDKWVDVFTFNSVAMEKLFRIFNFPLADQQLSFLKLNASVNSKQEYVVLNVNQEAYDPGKDSRTIFR